MKQPIPYKDWPEDKKQAQRERAKKCARVYYANNKEMIIEKAKEKYKSQSEEMKEQKKEYFKEYYIKNRERIIERVKTRYNRIKNESKESSNTIIPVDTLDLSPSENV